MKKQLFLLVMIAGSMVTAIAMDGEGEDWWAAWNSAEEPMSGAASGMVRGPGGVRAPANQQIPVDVVEAQRLFQEAQERIDREVREQNQKEKEQKAVRAIGEWYRQMRDIDAAKKELAKLRQAEQRRQLAEIEAQTARLQQEAAAMAASKLPVRRWDPAMGQYIQVLKGEADRRGLPLYRPQVVPTGTPVLTVRRWDPAMGTYVQVSRDEADRRSLPLYRPQEAATGEPVLRRRVKVGPGQYEQRIVTE